MNDNYRNLTRKLDLCGVVERVEQREAIQKQEQQAQQVAIDSRAAVLRGLRSYLEESYRKVDLQKLRDSDPATFAFLVQNSRHVFT